MNVKDPSSARGTGLHAAVNLSADERAAMRAFLQRCEVRLSTMHRVATAFMAGAGLLFLFPIFLKDGVLNLMRFLLAYVPPVPLDLATRQSLALFVTYLLVIFPLVLALAIPATALIFLLKDIVRFYFVGHPPGFPDDHFSPRFVLTGVGFSPDESEEVKMRVLRYEYGTSLMNFMLSHTEAKSRYYSDIIDKPGRRIVPRTRKLPQLIKQDVIDVPDGKPLDQLDDDDVLRVHGMIAHGDEEEVVLSTPYVERTVKEIDRFNAALGLAGMIDRSLAHEVAKMEVSLARHALHLRRLVLRYFEALLILLWTSFIIFMMQPFLEDQTGRFSPLVVFSAAFLLWAVLTPVVIDLPLWWLVRYSSEDVRKEGMRSFSKTDALQQFSRRARWFCILAVIASIVALFLEFYVFAM